ncbi:MAG: hypothetical protein WAV40_04290, partial [Microgenomates group bacterium]
ISYILISMEPETVAPQPIIIDPPVVDQQIVLPTPQVKKFSFLTAFLLILLSLSATFSIYLFLQVRAMTLEKFVPSPTPSPIASVDPTSNWQTYENEKFDFSFKYPQEIKILDSIKQIGDRLIIQKVASNETTIDTPQMIIALGPNGGRELDWYPTNASKELGEFPIEHINIGGIAAIKGESGQKQVSVPTIWVINGEFVYTIQLPTSLPESEKVFDQILSTFKFIDSSKNNEKTTLENFVKDTVYAYGKSHGLSSKDQIIVKIIQLAGNFASGSIAYTKEVEGSGEIWFAAKQNSNWIMVEETQEPPSCALMEQYQFPKSIYGECIAK